MLRVALTGTIGSGKSRILNSLGRMLQCSTIQADQIARQMMQVGAPGYLKFCRKYSDTYLLENGSLDRAKLKKSFTDQPSLKKEVERILHPLIRHQLMEITASANDLQQMIVFEVPLLFEVGWQSDFDVVIAVYVEYSKGKKRLMRRDRVDSGYADDLLAMQMSSWQKAMMADMVIDNTYCYTSTMFQLLRLVEQLKKMIR